MRELPLHPPPGLDTAVLKYDYLKIIPLTSATSTFFSFADFTALSCCTKPIPSLLSPPISAEPPRGGGGGPPAGGGGGGGPPAGGGGGGVPPAGGGGGGGPPAGGDGGGEGNPLA